MGCRHFLLLCATVSCFYFAAITAQNGGRAIKIPSTRFTCQGKPSGYYADIETGCQVYHMCDGLGRQFSYTCPNTTLFQQRMLICDHWYMVNCSRSESDYDANLLIGQRDKPFVSDADMQQRTPRPDILSVPPNNNYYDGLREAESKFPIHPGNSIVGVADSISSANNNGLDSAKQNYRPPSSWSMGTGSKQHLSTRPESNSASASDKDQDNLTGAASQGPGPTFQSTPADKDFNEDTETSDVTPPSQDLRPPFSPTTTEPSSQESDIDIRMRDRDPVFEFIKRFDPNSPDSHKTSMSRSEILDLNQHLPAGQSSAEEERVPRKNKNFGNEGNNFNRVKDDRNKGTAGASRFNTVNVKTVTTERTTAFKQSSQRVPEPQRVSVPDRNLLPPKKDFSEQLSTTMGPPIYYEWKWAVPAFDLEPPKKANETPAEVTKVVKNSGKSPFSNSKRATPKTVDPTPSNTEYNISSYFVPDYVFPLDESHSGYDEENARTSFQVSVARPGRASYGENPACPHCHPAYLEPGSCEPCIVKR